MPRASARDQIERLLDGLVACGFTLVESTELSSRPVELVLTDPDGVKSLRVFCWNVTSGGHGRAEDEYRVQTTRPGDMPLHMAGETTLVLGYDAERDIFVAWEGEKHPNPGSSSSLQVPLDLLEAAAETGMAARARPLGRDDESEVVTAFRPELVGEYLAASPELNVSDPQIAEATAAAASGEAAEHLEELPGGQERQRSISRVSRLVRNGQFRLRVLAAYDSRCAFCDLDASLAEAAHIKPVADGGEDQIRNGLAACPTHHKAFDLGLLVVLDDYAIRRNDQRLDELGVPPEEKERLEVGLRNKLKLPDEPQFHPAAENLAAHRARWAQHGAIRDSS